MAVLYSDVVNAGSKNLEATTYGFFTRTIKNSAGEENKRKREISPTPAEKPIAASGKSKA